MVPGIKGFFMKKIGRAGLVFLLCLGLCLFPEASSGSDQTEEPGIKIAWMETPGTETSVTETPGPDLPVSGDFLDWVEVNPHMVGWLQAGAGISYPVVQYDNDFYLHHDFYDRPDENGTLFVNEYNSLWPRDSMILIHGHNMKSGAMFGTLLQYENYDYLAAWPLINFRTIFDDDNVYYTPVAAFNASMVEDTPYYFNLAWLLIDEGPDEPETDEPETDEEGPGEAETDEEEPVEEITVFGEDTEEARKERYRKRFDIFMEAVTERSRWIAPVSYNADDDLLVLVTCSYYYEDGRFMLVCRKLRDYETAEEILELYRPSDDAEEDPELIIDW